MALFEDRRRSSHTKRLLAAATNSVASAGVAPPLSQEKIGCGTCQEQRHRLGRSISAPAAAAEVDSDSAAKRQRTLRKYFQVLLQSMRCPDEDRCALDDVWTINTLVLPQVQGV